MSAVNEAPIAEADFKRETTRYWAVTSSFGLIMSVLGIPLLLIWVPIVLLVTGRYLDSTSCVLTARSLKVKKGILTKIEKTIPLEKITDVGMVQGPLMRYFGVTKLTVETAGQSGVGALVSLTGVRDPERFREKILSQRDVTSGSADVPALTAPGSADVASLLTDIRDSLKRIESEISHGRTHP